MGALDTLRDGTVLLEELLFEAGLEPDARRPDWSDADSRVHLVVSVLRRRLLEPLDAALVEAGEERDPLAERTARVLGHASALLIAAREALEADRTLARAIEIASDGPLRAELHAGRADPEALSRLGHGRWLFAHGRVRQARERLRGFAASTPHEALIAAAGDALRGPQPVTTAPRLIRLNGFGLGLYGKRDTAADGSYVATYCVSALWLPVLPVAAYRVTRVGSGAYEFHTKERLDRRARTWQAIVALVAVGVLGAFAVRGYLESPARLARVGVRQAHALEREGRSTEAMIRYSTTAARYADEPAAGEAAEGVLRLAAGSVREPLAPEDVPVVSRVVLAFDRLPRTARTGRAAAYLTRRLNTWAEQVGQTDSRRARAGLAVVDLAARVAEGSDLKPIETRRAELRLALGGVLAREGRPVDALRELVQLDSPAAVRAAGDVVASLGEDVSLWNEAGDDVTRWASNLERASGQAEAAASARRRLQAARSSVEAALRTLETADERSIHAAAQRAPRNQELQVARAQQVRGRGDAAQCVSLISGVAPAGRLTAEAQQVLGGCLADTGDLERADDVLSRLLEERLTPFQRARKAYLDATRQLEEKLRDAANNGNLPVDVSRALERSTDDEGRDIVHTWVAETMAADVPLGALRATYLRHRAVVPASVTLGSVKLRRAADADGMERETLLKGAERAFLSIREEAEGAPAFHLGLGQVLYRLGRTQEGEKELRSLLDDKDPDLALDVGDAYRVLGLEARARTVFEKVYDTAGTTPGKHSAAFKRALVFVDLEDEEKWLKRANPASRQVRIRLVESRAERLMREGKRAEADQAFAQATAFYDRDAAHSAASANNAALALVGRYRATGDVAHLRAAAARLEAAARLAPDDTILLGNLADALEDLSCLIVAERWVRVRDLLLRGRESYQLLAALRNEPFRSQVTDALTKEPSFGRQLEVSWQEQILAPQKREPYERLARWLRWTGNAAGLQKLLRAVRQAGTVDSGNDEAKSTEGRPETSDTGERALAVAAVQRSEERLARVARLSDRHTQAAAFFLHADDVDTLASYAPSAESYGGSVEAMRKAVSLWPEAGFEVDLADALLKVAAYRAAASSPALKEAIERERASYRIARILHRATETPQGAAIAAALRSQPEFAEAVRLRKMTAIRQPTLTDWMVAQVAADRELEVAAAPVFARPGMALSYDIDAALEPHRADSLADRLLFQRHQAVGAAR